MRDVAGDKNNVSQEICLNDLCLDFEIVKTSNKILRSRIREKFQIQALNPVFVFCFKES